MEVVVSHKVESCRDCPHIDNNGRPRDAFSSAPAYLIWYCDHKGGPDIVADPAVIDPGCPIVPNVKSEGAEPLLAKLPLD